MKLSTVIDWIVKIAGMVICAPVTWLVAGELFADIRLAPLRFAMQLAGVLLVEGVLLRNWLQLELERNAAPEIKARYAFTALLMYTGLWILAIYHGEGLAGIVFRAALGAALVGSGWDTYVYTWQKATAKADKDIAAAGAVRRYRRKLAIAHAKETLTIEYDLQREQQQVDKEVELEAIQSGKQERLTLLKKEHEYNLSELETAFTTSDKNTGKKTLVKPLTQRQAFAKMLDIYRANPDASLREVGDKIGRSHQTVAAYLDSLEQQGKVHRNGKGVQVNS